MIPHLPLYRSKGSDWEGVYLLCLGETSCQIVGVIDNTYIDRLGQIVHAPGPDATELTSKDTKKVNHWLPKKHWLVD